MSGWQSTLSGERRAESGGIAANQSFERDGVRFVTGFRPHPGTLTLVKHEGMLRRYESVLRRHPQPRMVEVGLAYGGSAAWLALVADPKLLVGIELSTNPLDELSELITARGWEDRVRVHLGIDQGDRDRVRQIVEDALDGEQLDLVIDDASHLYGPTLATFETVFPFMAPGGTYIIEDWKGQDEIAHAVRAILADPRHPDHERLTAMANADGRTAAPAEDPCSRLAFELVLARTETTGLIESVTVDDHWIVVERGQAPLSEPFSIDALVTNHYGLLVPRR